MSYLGKSAASIVLAASVGLFGSTALGQQQPTSEQLQQQIETLQRQVNALQERKTSQETARRVREDAAQHSPLAATPFTGGWKDGKFILQSEDGRFTLNSNVQFQFRYIANNTDNGGGSDTQDGFEVRRAKFGFGGTVFSKDLSYNLVWSASRSGGAVSLEEAWTKYQLADQWAIRGGMFKDPLSHEQQLSSKKQLTVDRSLLNETLIGGDDFVEGVGLLYGNKDNPLHAEFAFTDGSQSHNTDFRNTGSNFGLAGRAEYKVFGDWKSYDDFSTMNNKKELLVLGAGADITQNGSDNALLHTVDAQYELTNGLAFYAAYVGRYSKSGDGDSVYDGGALGQVSYMLDRKWEIFGRYDFIKLDDASVPAGAETNVHEITAGMNYYFEGHNAKFTLDAVYLPNGAPTNQTGIGILASDDSEIVLRAQFQLLI
jgi:hypothetical protein